MAISLKKGQRINLKKEDNSKLEKFFVGANWGMIKKLKEPGFFSKLLGEKGPVEKTEAVDLDLAALLYNENKKLVEKVYFGNLHYKGIVHSGDDLTGDETQDEKDNEVISINLSEVPGNVKYIIFTLNSYNGVRFDKIPYANIRLYEGDKPGIPKKIFATYKVNNTPEFNEKLSLLLGALIKNDNGVWDFKALGIPVNDRRLENIIDDLHSNFDKLILS